MRYLGEMISIGVAFSWTATALMSEYGSQRMGNLVLNVLRMALTLFCSLIMFFLLTGTPVPLGGGRQAYGWLLLSGVVGYVIGDFCLFQCYLIIGSRYGQLFMTLAPLSAALTAWVALGQRMTSISIVAMLITLAGIGISVLGRDAQHHRVSLNLPLRGVLFAMAAALCQGIGLVLSKKGMDHYTMTGDQPGWLLPFYANFFRCLAGVSGFALLLAYTEGFGRLRTALHDRRSMSIASATTIFGPFVGVGFSLLALQYTNAGIASTLMALSPIIIILPSYLIFGQKITWKSVVGALISVGGVSLFFLA